VRALRPRRRLIYPLEEAAPIFEPSERIVICEVGNLPFLLAHQEQPGKIRRKQLDVLAILVSKRCFSRLARSETQNEAAIADTNRRADGRTQRILEGVMATRGTRVLIQRR
jgi:hypothetical protein